MNKRFSSNRIIRSITTSVIVTGFIAMPLVVQPAKVEAAFPGYNGKIAWQATRDGAYEIYVMDADGSNQVNLTNDPGFNDTSPSWSPDGTQVVFQSNRESAYDVYIMDANGSNPVNLTNSPAYDGFPDWSPDGAKIVFRSNRDGNNEIYVMNVDGSNQIRLTHNSASDEDPRFSPDGTQIVFMSMRDGNSEIYIMDSNGSNQTRLTENTVTDQYPNWSPDGQRIIWRATRDRPLPESPEIYTMNSDGSDQRPILGDLVVGGGGRPNWSPDGNSVVYYSRTEPGNDDIHMVNLIDGSITRLTFEAPADYAPYFQRIPNQTPQTKADTLTLQTNSSSTKDILANDIDEEALSATNLTIATQPTHGSVVIETGKVKYIPDKDYVGSDSLTYQICDSFMLDQKCATAVLSITVQAPTATPTPTPTSTPKPPVVTLSSIGTVKTVAGTTTYYYTGHRPTFTGTAEPGATINVEIHSDPIIFSTTADSSGSWLVTPDQDIPNGEHTVTITSTKDGLTSEPFTFTLGINTGMIPDTGADSTALRLLGVALLAGGVGTGLLRRQRVLVHRFPSLFS